MGTPRDAVTVGYVHSDQVAYSWHSSMLGMLAYDMSHQGRTALGGSLAVQCGPAGLVKARNETAEVFLGSGAADWLLWLDTDMGFPPDTSERLMEAADAVERPIVGALCFTQRQGVPDGMGGWRCAAAPTVFDWAREKDPWGGFDVRWNYPPNTLARCAGTGAACVLVHRSVFERIAAAHGPCWYDLAPGPDGQPMGEDLSFCARAGALGIPVHVHTGIGTSHMKRTWLSDSDYWQQQIATSAVAAQRIG